MSEMRNHIVLLHVYRTRGGNLHISKSLVTERSRKAIVATAKRQNIGLKWFRVFVAAIVNVNIAQVQTSVLMQTFSMRYSHHRTAVAAKFNSCNARHILSEVIYICRIVQLLHSFCRYVLHKTNRFHSLCADNRCRSLTKSYTAPFRIVIFRCIPALQ